MAANAVALMPAKNITEYNRIFRAEHDTIVGER
jgi:hypothetical protein